MRSKLTKHLINALSDSCSETVFGRQTLIYHNQLYLYLSQMVIFIIMMSMIMTIIIGVYCDLPNRTELGWIFPGHPGNSDALMFFIPLYSDSFHLPLYPVLLLFLTYPPSHSDILSESHTFCSDNLFFLRRMHILNSTPSLPLPIVYLPVVLHSLWCLAHLFCILTINH